MQNTRQGNNRVVQLKGNDMDKTKQCPCGEQHPKLIITDAGQGQKYALAYGHCCGEWCIEFRANYTEFDSDECMELAIDAWNQAPRKDLAQAEIDTKNGIIQLHQTIEAKLKDEIDELVYELKIARQLAEEVPITAGLKVTMKAWDTLIAKHKGE